MVNNHLLLSSRLIYSGELTRSIAGRREQRLAFLFDSEIILVKNNTHSGPKQPYFFKERIDLRSVACTMPGPCKKSAPIGAISWIAKYIYIIYYILFYI